MKKNILGTTALVAVLISRTFSAYSGSPEETATVDTTVAITGTQAADSKEEETIMVEAETTQASAELKEIVVGASPASHVEILNTAREVLVPKGYELKIVEYTDYMQPGNALDSGDLDANYFQHKPYLDSLDTQNGTKLVSAGAIHYESFDIYAGKTASLEEFPDKATILTLNDVSNEAGALSLLEAQGPIKLKDGVGLKAAKNDIVKNIKNLDIIELKAVQLSCSILDGDVAVISGNYATEAESRISDVLATEDSQSLAITAYGNVVVARKGEESSGAIKVLVEALTSPEVRQFTEEAYGGAVVLLF